MLHPLHFQPARLARRPYCTDDRSSGLQIRNAAIALSHRYIQANSPALQFRLVFDIDHDVRAVAHERRWHDDFGVPEPNWTALTPGSGRAHVAYELAVPIAKHDNARSGPIRYGAAVEGGLARQLRADLGYSGLICKNPMHESWKNVIGRAEPYELAELAEWVELLPKSRLKRDAVSGALGRNCLLFEQLRLWSYQNILPFKSACGNYNAWVAELLSQGLEFNVFESTGLSNTHPLAFNEVLATARSIARYTWRHFSSANLQALIDRTHTSEQQAMRGRRAGEVRRVATESQRATARLLHAQGKTMRTIAAELAVNQSTISRWLA